ncbi:acyl-CoA dehydrogenase family protein [Solimonas terrae]|uniref:Acyl-CoA dehydrogenase n=1 Tax=Solimonas terrae TaxID=1396819 RepID=A0A6M2BLY2_9GAMM|nr:acyl-CoA dehydrogenase family protein [Solimonas terrae]NGY03330.1 acyl-CoA dehydrogenase [Solimonas terrae]
MDFKDSDQDAAFRQQVREWLAANALRRRDDEDLRTNESALLEYSKAWQAKKADARYACITWPEAWGGRGGRLIEQAIFDEEEEKLGLDTGVFTIGLGMCVPTVMAFADKATKARLVAPALRGEQIWCQLFSEPSAGSDVAGVRTRAVLADDGSGDWIVDGQKVWTSGAHYSDFGIVLVRTNPDVPKHKGLTMFWVDMKAQGISVVPIRQASDQRDFNEVYFNGVRIPDSQRLGEIDGGWKVALFTLMNERVTVGGAMGAGWRDLLKLAQGLPGLGGTGTAAGDGAFRARLAEGYVMSEGLRLTRLRALTALSRGQTPGPENSIGKVVAARQMQVVAYEALDILDQYGMVNEMGSHSLPGRFQWNFFWGAAMRIAGGTDEILKNIISERVLGMPADIRVDRDVTFKSLSERRASSG